MTVPTHASPLAGSSSWQTDPRRRALAAPAALRAPRGDSALGRLPQPPITPRPIHPPACILSPPPFLPTLLSYLIKLLFCLLFSSIWELKMYLQLAWWLPSSTTGIIKWDIMKNQCRQHLKPLKVPRDPFYNLHKGSTKEPSTFSTPPN